MTPRLPLFILRLLSISLVSLRSAFGSVELCSDRELPWLFRKRLAVQLVWRWKCRGFGGRPRVPEQLRMLIAEMVRENPTWGEALVASELALKLGVHVSQRTVRAYRPENLHPSRGPYSQSYSKAGLRCGTLPDELLRQASDTS